MKKTAVVFLFGVLSFLATTASAQEYSRIDLFAGYSYVRANPGGRTLPSFNMNGGEATFAYNANSWLSGVADFAGYQTGRLTSTAAPGTTGYKGNMYTYLFGPRFSYRHAGRFTPYGQTLFGVAHALNGTYLLGKQTDFAMTLGGGLDVRLSSRISLRPVQADYLLTHFAAFEATQLSEPKLTQNNVRLSSGVVFHF
jgi:Outer membrane protein beta-barrel domain